MITSWFFMRYIFATELLEIIYLILFMRIMNCNKNMINSKVLCIVGNETKFFGVCNGAFIRPSFLLTFSQHTRHLRRSLDGISSETCCSFPHMTTGSAVFNTLSIIRSSNDDMNILSFVIFLSKTYAFTNNLVIIQTQVFGTTLFLSLRRLTRFQ